MSENPDFFPHFDYEHSLVASFLKKKNVHTDTTFLTLWCTTGQRIVCCPTAEIQMLDGGAGLFIIKVNYPCTTDALHNYNCDLQLCLADHKLLHILTGLLCSPENNQSLS